MTTTTTTTTTTRSMKLAAALGTRQSCLAVAVPATTPATRKRLAGASDGDGNDNNADDNRTRRLDNGCCICNEQRTGRRQQQRQRRVVGAAAAGGAGGGGRMTLSSARWLLALVAVALTLTLKLTVTRSFSFSTTTTIRSQMTRIGGISSPGSIVIVRQYRPMLFSTTSGSTSSSTSTSTSTTASTGSTNSNENENDKEMENSPMLLVGGGGTGASKFLDDNNQVTDVRAGEWGYSVLRQPASKARWDPDSIPQFDFPDSLSELEDAERDPNNMNNNWWRGNAVQLKSSSSAFASNVVEKKSAAATATTATAADTTWITTPEDFDLYQRTVDTLDYPRVLKALLEECTTEPARNIVQQTLTASNWCSSNPNNSKKKQQQLDNKNININNNKLLTAAQQQQQQRIPAGCERAYQPLEADTVEGSQERYRAVQEMIWLLEKNWNYSFKTEKGYKQELFGRPPPLSAGGELDFQLILSAVNQGRVLEAAELQDVAAMMRAMEQVLAWSAALRTKVKLDEDGLEFVALPKLADCIQLNTTLQDLLYNAFEKDNVERLSGTTFPKIGQLRARVRSLKSEVLGKLDALVALPSIQSKLALESGGALYSEVAGGRLVIPVDARYANTVGIVHDSSRSGKTAYVEPTEIVSSTNELRQAEGALRQEEARVWRFLTEQILHNQVSLTTSVNAMGQLDLVMARVLLGRRLSGTIPVVRNEGVICVQNAKHPVLLLRQIRNVVGSDVQLGVGTNQGLVLTGPNSGGKTIILKLLGLLALMSRGGIPIPVNAAAAATTAADRPSDNNKDGDVALSYQPRVDFFNPVLADIGDLQSVGGDLSTFSGHMLVCREVLTNASPNALVLMDELGSGTDPAQGVAIAQALLEALLETGCRVAITTHYMQLKTLAASDERFAVGGMQFVQGRPTYKMLPGTVGESFALSVAERLRLPPSVIARANELLDSETRQMGDLIRDLEDQKALVEEQAAALEAKRQELAQLETEMKEERIRLEKKQLNARRDEARKFAQKLEEKERILQDVLEKLKSDPSRKVIAKSWDDIKFVKRDALNEAEQNMASLYNRQQRETALTTTTTAMDDASTELVPLSELRDKPTLNPGDKLVVCKAGPFYGKEATLEKALNGRVQVKVQNIAVTLKFDDVALAPKGSFSAAVAASSSNKGSNNALKRGGVNGGGRGSISRAAQKALEEETKSGGGSRKSSSDSWQSSSAADSSGVEVKKSSSLMMRTESNTVNVLGCNLEEAKEKVKSKMSSSLMNGRTVIYILHGHGTGGVLKSKIRAWLKSEEGKLIRKWQPADMSDGGDACTCVELR